MSDKKGEIIVKFIHGINGPQTIIMLGLRTIYHTGALWRVEVPLGTEQQWIGIFKKRKDVQYAGPSPLAGRA